MATHSSILAWRTPWTEEPGGYSSWIAKKLDRTERLNNKQIFRSITFYIKPSFLFLIRTISH